MIRKLCLILASIGMLGVVSTAPPALATHGPAKPPTGGHENSPMPPLAGSPNNTCAVAGTVNISPGVPATPQPIGGKAHNHFRFEDVVITCTGPLADFDGTYEVNAAGGTDGMGGTQVIADPSAGVCTTEAPCAVGGAPIMCGGVQSNVVITSGTGTVTKTCDGVAILACTGTAPAQCQAGPPVAGKTGAMGCTKTVGVTGACANSPIAIASCDDDPAKDPKCSINHGEDVSVGWSNSSCYAPDCPPTSTKVDDIYEGVNTNAVAGLCYNCNEITADNGAGEVSCSTTPATCENVLKFCRGIYDDRAGLPDLPNSTCTDSTGGGNIKAWGALTDWSHTTSTLCFLANLEAAALANPGTLPPAGQINTIAVVGTASTWVASKASCLGAKNTSSLG